jgi:hypothetical protein
MTFTPQWTGVDGVMSSQMLMSAFSLPAGILYGAEPSGQLIQGFDPSLGIGTFIYAQVSNVTGVTAGNVCEITQTLLSSGASVSVVNSVQQWAGTVNSGKTLCVALAAVAQNQFGWFQIYGAAVVSISGAFTVGSSAYWNALGVVQSAAVASKQMVSAQCVVATGANFGQAVSGVVPVLSASQAVLFLNSPHAQSAIT